MSGNYSVKMLIYVILIFFNLYFYTFINRAGPEFCRILKKYLANTSPLY